MASTTSIYLEVLGFIAAMPPGNGKVLLTDRGFFYPSLAALLASPQEGLDKVCPLGVSHRR